MSNPPNPLHPKAILAGIIVTVISGLIGAYLLRELKIEPYPTPTLKFASRAEATWTLEAPRAFVEPTPIPVLEPTLTDVPQPTPIPVRVPRIYNVAVCPQPCTGSNAARTFPQKTTKLYVRWNYENIPVGASYSRTWTMNGREWIRYDCVWQGPETGVDSVTLTEPKGLYSGAWQVTITVNGVMLARMQVVVQGNWNYWDPAGIFNTCYGKQ